ncbi:hypothetical protein [Novipirellula sp.]|uniref:hypothetical protein n=1 Tax=Novipirellula sp. TaxID=2795430 RepID=UPI0035659BB5
MATEKSNGDAIGIESRNGTQEISVTSASPPVAGLAGDVFGHFVPMPQQLASVA